LADDHPELASVETIGQSTEKRALKVIRISRGTNEHYKKRKVWIDAGLYFFPHFKLFPFFTIQLIINAYISSQE